MRRRALLAGASVFLGAAMAPRRVAVLGNNGPSLDLSFINGAPLDGRITFTRASSATSGVYTDATASAYTSYGSNVARLSSNGFLIEEQRTNSLLNSDAPATQTTASLATGTYTLWVIGTGSATSSAGTATGSGFGAATAGVPNIVTLTGAGTVTVTASGSLTRFQLEKGAFASSYIPTTGSTATRAADSPSMPLGSWFNPNAVTMVVEANLLSGPVNPAAQFLGEIGDGTNLNKLQISRNASSNTINAILNVSNIGIANLNAGTVVPGTPFKAGFASGSGGSISSINGNSGPNSGTAMPAFSAPTTLFIGKHFNLSFQANSYIRRIRYWPRALSQNDLNGATT